MDHAHVPFESAQLLIERAEENLRDFPGRVKEYYASNPLETITEDDPHSLDTIVKVKLKPVPTPIRGVISDCVNNLRHALDHATNDAAVMLRGGQRNCYFPFGRDAGDFANIFGSRRYKTIPVALRPFLSGLKPYFAGNDLLYTLGRISGPNKHQVVIRAIGLAENQVRVNNTVLSDSSISVPAFDSAKGEMEVFRVGYYGKAKADVSITATVAIIDRALPAPHPAPTLLNAFRHEVRDIVAGMEAEARRLLAAKGEDEIAI